MNGCGGIVVLLLVSRPHYLHLWGYGGEIGGGFGGGGGGGEGGDSSEDPDSDPCCADFALPGLDFGLYFGLMGFFFPNLNLLCLNLSPLALLLPLLRLPQL